MRPLRLKFQGLRSWREEVTVDFESLGLFALIGDTGAGKSSILDALYFALYGSLTWDSASAKPLISIGMTRMSVELDFTADGRTYRVSRAISPGNYPPAKHLLECLDNPEERYDSETDIKEQIKRLVGLDAKAFQMAVLLPQGKFGALLCANPAVRTDLLKGIFRLDVLDRVRQEAENLRDSVAAPLDRARRIRSQYPVDPRAELAMVDAELTAASSRSKDLTAAFQSLSKAYAGQKEANEARLRAESSCKQLFVKISDDLKALQPIADEVSDTAGRSGAPRCV